MIKKRQELALIIGFIAVSSAHALPMVTGGISGGNLDSDNKNINAHFTVSLENSNAWIKGSFQSSKITTQNNEYNESNLEGAISRQANALVTFNNQRMNNRFYRGGGLNSDFRRAKLRPPPAFNMRGIVANRMPSFDFRGGAGQIIGDGPIEGGYINTPLQDAIDACVGEDLILGLGGVSCELPNNLVKDYLPDFVPEATKYTYSGNTHVFHNVNGDFSLYSCTEILEYKESDDTPEGIYEGSFLRVVLWESPALFHNAENFNEERIKWDQRKIDCDAMTSADHSEQSISSFDDGDDPNAFIDVSNSTLVLRCDMNGRSVGESCEDGWGEDEIARARKRIIKKMWEDSAIQDGIHDWINRPMPPITPTLPGLPYWPEPITPARPELPGWVHDWINRPLPPITPTLPGLPDRPEPITPTRPELPGWVHDWINRPLQPITPTLPGLPDRPEPPEPPPEVGVETWEQVEQIIYEKSWEIEYGNTFYAGVKGLEFDVSGGAGSISEKTEVYESNANSEYKENGVKSYEQDDFYYNQKYAFIGGGITYKFLLEHAVFAHVDHETTGITELNAGYNYRVSENTAIYGEVSVELDLLDNVELYWLDEKPVFQLGFDYRF